MVDVVLGNLAMLLKRSLKTIGEMFLVNPQNIEIFINSSKLQKSEKFWQDVKDVDKKWETNVRAFVLWLAII